MKTKIALLFLVVFHAFVSGALAAPSKPSKPSAPDKTQLFEKGTTLLLEEKYEAAEKPLRAAVEADPKLAKAHNNLAFVLRKQGEPHYAEALKHYNQAIELNEKLAEAYMYRGVLHLAMGNKESALADHQKLLDLGEVALAAELEWVIENGKEKTPTNFFGVVKTR